MDRGQRVRLLIIMSKICPWSRGLASGLQSLGADVHVFDFADDYESGYITARVPGVMQDAEKLRSLVSDIHLARPWGGGKLRYLLGAYALRRTAARVRPDAVLALYGGGYSLMAYLSGVRPYFTYAVGSDVLLANGLIKRINRLTFGVAAMVFANGQHLAERARAQAPQACVVPLLMGVDPSAFPLATPRGPQVRLVCIRGFESVYNNEDVIRALSRLPSDLPDFRFVFTSGGPLLDRATELADRILPAARRQQVEFWGGVGKAEIGRALASSHVFVSYSLSDGTATALLEALACGIYPVLSDIPANRPWVDPAVSNGELVPLDDVAALAASLSRVIRDPSLATTHRAFNRELVISRADARINLQTLLKKISDIL